MGSSRGTAYKLIDVCNNGTKMHTIILKLVYIHNELPHVAAMWSCGVHYVCKLMLTYTCTFLRAIIMYSNNTGILDHRKLSYISFIPEVCVKREQK